MAAKNGLVINDITNHIPSHATPPIDPDSAGGWLKLLNHSSIPVTNIAAIAPIINPPNQAIGNNSNIQVQPNLINS
ncbi:hypothetical protein BV372_26880 [Nostoc sp. T09]|nr:hypothetical protein BV372_26880 [Nostoc sp. T09]